MASKAIVFSSRYESGFPPKVQNYFRNSHKYQKFYTYFSSQAMNRVYRNIFFYDLHDDTSHCKYIIIEYEGRQTPLF